jgi:GH15 family glucan-1,4-alpha-glucosidase
MRGGLVDRYHTAHTDDGFAGEEEGTFTICTLWLCLALLEIGDTEAAQAIFDRVCSCANDLGLLAEELTPGGEQLGNYPQAFTHIALILCAFALEESRAAVRAAA